MLNPTLLTVPAFHLNVFVLASVAAGLCLLSVWAGLSRRHWFWRAAVAGAGIVAMLPVRAYEPAVLFLIVVPLTAAATRLMRQRLLSSGDADMEQTAAVTTKRFTFGMRDYLLGMILLGALAAVLAELRRQQMEIEWLDLLVTATCLAACATLTTAVVFLRPLRVRLAVVLFFALVASSSILACKLTDWLELEDVLARQDLHREGFDLWEFHSQLELKLADTVCLLIGLGEFSGLMLVMLFIGRSTLMPTPPIASGKWTSLKAQSALGLALLVGFAPAGTIYCLMLQPPAAVPESFTGTNNYPRIVELARYARTLNRHERSLSQISLDPGGKARREQVAHIYQELLLLLNEPAYVPFDGARGATHDYGKFRSVADMWYGEAEEAVASGRIDEAFNYSVAIVQLGNVYSRGGLVGHAILGSDLEGGGISHLSEFRHELSKSDARKLLALLQHLEQASEPLETIAARTAVWDDEVKAWRSRFARAIQRLSGNLADPYNAFWPAMQQRDLRRGLLKAELAIRLFQSDRGQLPRNLDELVPDYLPAVPLEPWSGKPFVYRLSRRGCHIYSVGPDGHDAGGQVAPWNSGEALDLDLDCYIQLRTGNSSRLGPSRK